MGSGASTRRGSALRTRRIKIGDQSPDLISVLLRSTCLMSDICRIISDYVVRGRADLLGSIGSCLRCLDHYASGYDYVIYFNFELDPAKLFRIPSADSPSVDDRFYHYDDNLSIHLVPQIVSADEWMRRWITASTDRKNRLVYDSDMEDPRSGWAQNRKTADLTIGLQEFIWYWNPQCRYVAGQSEHGEQSEWIFVLDHQPSSEPAASGPILLLNFFAVSEWLSDDKSQYLCTTSDSQSQKWHRRMDLPFDRHADEPPLSTRLTSFHEELLKSALAQFQSS